MPHGTHHPNMTIPELAATPFQETSPLYTDVAAIGNCNRHVKPLLSVAHNWGSYEIEGGLEEGSVLEALMMPGRIQEMSGQRVMWVEF